MANFNFVNSAKFKPFSYQEMLQPVQAYTQVYNEVQDGLGELGAKADVFDQLANQQTDPITHAKYKQYADELTKKAELLATQGLNPTITQGLTDLRRRYSRDIIPIEQAYTKRQGWVDAQMKGKMADSTLIVEDASSISLDDIIANPAMAPTSYSGREITKMSAQASAAIAKEMRDDPRKWSKILDNQYYETMMRKGATKEEVIATLMNDANSNPELRKIIEDTIAATGISEWRGVKDAEGNLTDYGKQMMEQVENFAGQGLWSSIGDTTYQNLTNQKELLQAKNPNPEPPNKHKKVYTPVPRTEVIRTKHKELDKDLQYLQDFKAGKIDMTETAKRMPPMTLQSSVTGFGNIPNGDFEEYNVFQDRIKSITEKYGTKDPDEIISKIQKMKSESAIRDFVYQLDVTDSNEIMAPIMDKINTSTSSEGYTGLREFEDQKVGDPMKSSNLNDFRLAKKNIAYDPSVGIIINAVDSKGALTSYVLDPEIIDDTDRNIYKTFENLKKLQEEGDYDVYHAALDNFFQKTFYDSVNRAKVGTRTDSKIGAQ